MARTDLLSLSPDDLAALSNRGTVNAARKDLETGVTGTLSESEDGAVRAEWSDGRTSEVPAGKPLRAGRCSCNAIGTCKHLVRLVLWYQQQTPAEAAAPAGPWDPGEVSDDELARHFRPAALARARKVFDAGVMAELVRGVRPVAQFHLPVCTVRFLVPGDLRYTRCGCARPAPCDHVPLAVWAFRHLERGRKAGLVTAGAAAPPADPATLDELDALLADFVIQGISGAGQTWPARLTRLENRCRDAGLTWPAEVLHELGQQQAGYGVHDARFDPGQVASLLGELVLRLDAVRNDTGHLPQALIRGGDDGRAAELGPGQQFWGLGCGVRLVRGAAEIAAYLYDVKAGNVVVVVKDFPDGDREEDVLRPFAALGRRVAIPGRQGANQGPTFHDLGAGILQLNGGRRSASHELLPGRSGVALSVHDRLAWEEIQPPVFVEEFAELEERLACLPPSALRPRRVAEDFHVLRVAAVEDARFDTASQSVQALLADGQGRHALLEHPYLTRGRAGTELLLARLTAGNGELRFVAGMVRRTVAGLVVRPAALVWQEGERRTLLQPWVAGQVETSGEASGEGAAAEVRRAGEDVVAEHVREVQFDLGEMAVLGLARADAVAARRWRELAVRGEESGFARLPGRVKALGELLEARSRTLRWDPRPAAEVLLELAGLVRLARDVS